MTVRQLISALVRVNPNMWIDQFTLQDNAFWEGLSRLVNVQASDLDAENEAILTGAKLPSWMESRDAESRDAM